MADDFGEIYFQGVAGDDGDIFALRKGFVEDREHVLVYFDAVDMLGFLGEGFGEYAEARSDFEDDVIGCYL